MKEKLGHLALTPTNDRVNDEMFVTWYGPEIGECDEILKTVLDLNFKNQNCVFISNKQPVYYIRELYPIFKKKN